MKGANHDIIFSYQYHILLISCQNRNFFACIYNFWRSYKNGFEFTAVLILIKIILEFVFSKQFIYSGTLTARNNKSIDFVKLFGKSYFHHRYPALFQFIYKFSE